MFPGDTGSDVHVGRRIPGHHHRGSGVAAPHHGMTQGRDIDPLEGQREIDMAVDGRESMVAYQHQQVIRPGAGHRDIVPQITIERPVQVEDAAMVGVVAMRYAIDTRQDGKQEPRL